MVIILQLALFCLAIILRGRFLFGQQLKVGSANTNRLDYISKGKNSVNNRHVGVSQVNGIPLLIQPERWYHKLLKSIGIATEIKIKDADFDQDFFITSDMPHNLESALQSGDLLKNLQALFALPVRSLHGTQEKLWCTIKKNDVDQPEKYYDQHVEILNAISKALVESARNAFATSRPKYLCITAFVVICVHAGVLTLGAFGFAPTLMDSVDTIDKVEWIAKGMVAGGTIAGLWLIVVLSIFNRTSWVCWVVADFVLCGILGFTLSGIFVTRELNTHLSQPAPQIHAQQVLLKTCELKCKKSCGKRCTRHSNYPLAEGMCAASSRPSYMQQIKTQDSTCRNGSAWYDFKLQVTHWKKPQPYTFEPLEKLFDRTKSGGFLNVPVYKGALGFEWVNTDDIDVK